MCAKQRHISRLGKHDEIRRLAVRHPDQGETDVALDATAVGDLERLPPLRNDRKLLEYGTRYPRILAPDVHESIVQRATRTTQLPVLDLDRSTLPVQACTN